MGQASIQHRERQERGLLPQLCALCEIRGEALDAEAPGGFAKQLREPDARLNSPLQGRSTFRRRSCIRLRPCTSPPNPLSAWRVAPNAVHSCGEGDVGQRRQGRWSRPCLLCYSPLVCFFRGSLRSPALPAPAVRGRCAAGASGASGCTRRGPRGGLTDGPPPMGSDRKMPANGSSRPGLKRRSEVCGEARIPIRRRACR